MYFYKCNNDICNILDIYIYFKNTLKDFFNLKTLFFFDNCHEIIKTTNRILGKYTFNSRDTLRFVDTCIYFLDSTNWNKNDQIYQKFSILYKITIKNMNNKFKNI